MTPPLESSKRERIADLSNRLTHGEQESQKRISTLKMQSAAMRETITEAFREAAAKKRDSIESDALLLAMIGQQTVCDALENINLKL